MFVDVRGRKDNPWAEGEILLVPVYPGIVYDPGTTCLSPCLLTVDLVGVSSSHELGFGPLSHLRTFIERWKCKQALVHSKAK